jgi:DNA-binding SARP family transcriptional activator/energy-coupling factor transporter ATP-binding protein EcfA2
MARLKISLLGGFRVACDGHPRLSLTRKKGQALLALLALRPGTGYPRDALTALLWSDARDEQARHSLRQELHELRRALAPTKTRALIVDAERIALSADAVEVDVASFERLAAEATPEALKRAAALYEGDLLAGVGVRETAFEDHLRSERERLRQRAFSVLTRLLDHQSQRNLVEAAIETALRLLGMDATQETVHRALMMLYARNGRRAAALRQYQECVEVLQRELGVEPEAATRQLYRQILAASGSAPTPAEPPVKRAPGGRTVARHTDRFGVDPPLAGRQADLATLRDALERACTRRGHVVAIIGEAGVGKTRIVTELAALARDRDARTTIGRAYETAQVLAFGPWVDALRVALSAAPEALAALEPAWRAELARVLPEAAARAPRPADPADTTRIFQAIEQLIDRLAARQPLMIVLEDAHWADDLTLRLAAYLGRRLERRAILLVLTAREENLGDAAMLEVALKELRDRLLTVPLSPLSRAETTSLVRSLSRAERDAAALSRLDERAWAVSAGNPLLVVETVRALRDAPADHGTALPTRVRELVLTRLARLSERARRVVAIASLIGRESEFRLLQHCAGLDDRDAAEVVEELVRRRVFHGVGERLDFTHDRIREAARTELVAAQVPSLHRLIATSMETIYAGDLESHTAALAAHCRDGELWEKAVTYLMRAGMRAAERSAHREAGAAFEQVLAALARLPESSRTLELAIDIRLALHTSCYALAEIDRGYQALRDAEAPAAKLGDARRSALLACQTGQYFWVTGRSREALPLFEHAATVAKSLDDFALLMSSTLYIGSSRFCLGDLRESEDAFRRVIDALRPAAAGEKLGLHGLPLVFAASGLAAVLAEQGRFAEARALGEESVQIAESLSHAYTLVFALRILGHALTVEGRLDEAVRILERGRALSEDTSLRSLAPNILASLGYAYAMDRRRPPGRLEPNIEWSLGYAQVRGGDAEGVPMLARALETLEQFNQRVWYSVLLCQLAEAWLVADDVDRARQCAERAHALAVERGERGFEAAALRMLGAVAARATPPDVDAARRHYTSALRLAQERGLRPLTAHCHSDLAALYEAAGQPDLADRHRAMSLDISREIGMAAPVSPVAPA